MSEKGIHFGSQILIRSENKKEAFDKLMEYISNNFSREPNNIDYLKEAMGFVGVSVELNSQGDVSEISHLRETEEIDKILKCLSKFIEDGSYVRVGYIYPVIYEYRVVENSIEKRVLDIDAAFENPNTYKVED